MIADSSALLAVLFREAEGDAIHRLLTERSPVAMGAPTWLETAMVFSSQVEGGVGILRSFIDGVGITIVPFEAGHTALAASAFLRYGRGRHSRAALNYGDCMTYAVAKSTALPLLCKGEDFAHTDLELVPF